MLALKTHTAALLTLSPDSSDCPEMQVLQKPFVAFGFSLNSPKHLVALQLFS